MTFSERNAQYLSTDIPYLLITAFQHLVVIALPKSAVYRHLKVLDGPERFNRLRCTEHDPYQPGDMSITNFDLLSNGRVRVSRIRPCRLALLAVDFE